MWIRWTFTRPDPVAIWSGAWPNCSARKRKPSAGIWKSSLCWRKSLPRKAIAETAAPAEIPAKEKEEALRFLQEPGSAGRDRRRYRDARLHRRGDEQAALLYRGSLPQDGRTPLGHDPVPFRRRQVLPAGCHPLADPRRRLISNTPGSPTRPCSTETAAWPIRSWPSRSWTA